MRPSDREIENGMYDPTGEDALGPLGVWRDNWAWYRDERDDYDERDYDDETEDDERR